MLNLINFVVLCKTVGFFCRDVNLSHLLVLVDALWHQIMLCRWRAKRRAHGANRYSATAVRKAIPIGIAASAISITS